MPKDPRYFQKNLHIPAEIGEVIDYLSTISGHSFSEWVMDDPRLIRHFRSLGKDVPNTDKRLHKRVARAKVYGAPITPDMEEDIPLPEFPWNTSIIDRESSAGPFLVWNEIDLEDLAKTFIVTACAPVRLKRTLTGWDVYRINGEFAAKMYLHPYTKPEKKK